MIRTTMRISAFLLVATLHVSAFAQRQSSANAPSPRQLAGTPTASSFTYPQSLFVDSYNGNIWVADFDNNRVLRFDVGSLTAVEGNKSTVPEGSGLSQNFPNPFNPSTTVTFAVKGTEHAKITVYNVLGQEVATLFDGIAQANVLYSVSFDAGNLAGGIYFYALRSATRNEMKKMCLLR